MYFLIFHSEDMLGFKKDCISISPKYFSGEFKIADFVKLCFTKPGINVMV